MELKVRWESYQGLILLPLNLVKKHYNPFKQPPPDTGPRIEQGRLGIHAPIDGQQGQTYPGHQQFSQGFLNQGQIGVFQQQGMVTSQPVMSTSQPGQQGIGIGGNSQLAPLWGSGQTQSMPQQLPVQGGGWSYQPNVNQGGATEEGVFSGRGDQSAVQCKNWVKF